MSKGVSPNTNIQIESELGYRSSSNSDSFRDIYKIKAFVEVEEGITRLQDVFIIDFNNPFLEMNKHFLLARCDIKQFQPRWKNRPNYLSFDEYGVTSFGYLLLFVNECISLIDFDFEYVRVPKMSAIKELIINNMSLYPDRNKIKDVRFL